MTCLIDAIDMNLTFNEQTVRVFGTLEEPLFVLKDVCNILGLSNPSKTIENVDKDYHLSLEVRGGNSSGIQQTLVVKEPGLYQVIMRCRKDVAKPFQRWVCGEVLPSLRKKGEYRMKEDYQKKLEEMTKIIEDKNMIIENKTKELEDTQQLIGNKVKELENIEKKLVRSKKLYQQTLEHRSRTPYELGNVVYVISNPHFKSVDEKDDIKFGKSTQTNETYSAFKNRLSTYNTGSPVNYTVHAVFYVNENSDVEDHIKIKFRKNLVETNKEWLRGVSVKELVDYITQYCKMLDYEYKAIIYDDPDSESKFELEIKMEHEANLKIEEEKKRKHENEIAKLQKLAELEARLKEEEDKNVKRWREVVDGVNKYTDLELEKVIIEFSLEKRKGREITRRQVKTRLEKRIEHPELYLTDDQTSDAIKIRIEQNLNKYDEYELRSICKKYKLMYSNTSEGMRETINNFVKYNSIDTRRRRNMYKYNTKGELVHHYSSMTLFSEETGICRNTIPFFRDVLCVANGYLWTSEPKRFTLQELEDACKNSKTFRQNLGIEEHKEIYNRYVNEKESKKDLMLEYDISDTQFKRIISSMK
jgi:prophage antirepressor-like protein